MFDYVSKIQASLDNKKKAASIFLDLFKAFDTVNHEILLLELDKMKIKGNELRSFKNYLTNRRQLFEINGEVSLF